MKEVSPQEAYELMKSDANVIYLDVRSIPEFEAGHPASAINIPLLHLNPGAGMAPNEDFLKVVEANLPKDSKLVVGCKAGGRSARACDVLAQSGYTDVTNVRAGFVAATDNTGRVVEPGWSMLNLPIATETPAEARYDTLLANAKK
jgi:rhodanese-related sulfurtransferase